MAIFKLKLNHAEAVDCVWDWLLAKGATPLFSEEEGAQVFLLVEAADESMLQHPHVLHIEPSALPAIDWTDQWASNCPQFNGEVLTLDLQPHADSIKLLPGPGFGDFSHPSTQLAMKLLLPLAAKAPQVVDIGCGSGILSLAAHAAGAASIIGIDICKEALEHAKKNSAFNGFSIAFTLPDAHPEVKKGALLVMNMILSEQKVAISALSENWNKKEITLILSGLLLEHREETLAFYSSFGLHLQEEVSDGQWLALQLQ